MRGDVRRLGRELTDAARERSRELPLEDELRSQRLARDGAAAASQRNLPLALPGCAGAPGRFRRVPVEVVGFKPVIWTPGPGFSRAPSS